jgi:hypothetical protein
VTLGFGFGSASVNSLSIIPPRVILYSNISLRRKYGIHNNMIRVGNV